MPENLKCKQCGACCIALSISSPIPGMPKGKSAGVRCVNLGANNLCLVYSERPSVCAAHAPSKWLCGNSFSQAMKNTARLEALTKP
ncbi:MAG: YkgJ family cysteine cluster protein [Spirochaetia bacterium]|nr:YkgJ family cysteine cluster protein [Spirochaetia bacterium]